MRKLLFALILASMTPIVAGCGGQSAMPAAPIPPSAIVTPSPTPTPSRPI